MPMALLPGQVSQNRETGPAVVWALVGLALVLAVGAWRFRPQPRLGAETLPASAAPAVVNPPAPTASPTPAPNNRDATADLRLHVGHSQQQLIVAAEQLAAARRMLAALSPELDRNYLQFQKRRADSAWIACDVVEGARLEIALAVRWRAADFDYRCEAQTLNVDRV